MHFERQLRLRVLEALELEAKQFRTREELFPIRIPREPIRLDEVIERTLGDDSARFDPTSIRARTILHLEWDDGSVWDAWVIMLPSQLRLFCDSGGEETRVLGSGGRNAGDETDRQFLSLLAESAGETFGSEMSGGAPSLVRSSIDDRAFLVDVFVNLFEIRAMEGVIREDLDDRGVDRRHAHDLNGTDFRFDVERWLDVIEVWRQWADDVRGKPIESGHYLAEEAPEAAYEALRAFFSH